MLAIHNSIPSKDISSPSSLEVATIKLILCSSCPLYCLDSSKSSSAYDSNRFDYMCDISLEENTILYFSTCVYITIRRPHWRVRDQ